MDGHHRYRRDTGERFAAETERFDIIQIFRLTDLAGGVRQKRGFQVVLFDAATVVYHFDLVKTGVCHRDLNLGGACVNGVFDKLLDDGGGTFHHFAGGNFVVYRTVQFYDLHHFTLDTRSAKMENACIGEMEFMSMALSSSASFRYFSLVCDSNIVPCTTSSFLISPCIMI